MNLKNYGYKVPDEMHTRLSQRWKTHGNVTEWKWASVNTGPPGSKARLDILTVIDQHTTSGFYMAFNFVSFESDEDYIMFKLGYL